MKMKEGENMNYWDIIFIGIYLPLTVIIYNFIKQKNRWKVLLISSYIFFWSISGKLLIYLLMTTLLMHYFGLWITEIRNEMDDTLGGYKITGKDTDSNFEFSNIVFPSEYDEKPVVDEILGNIVTRLEKNGVKDLFNLNFDL